MVPVPTSYEVLLVDQAEARALHRAQGRRRQALLWLMLAITAAACGSFYLLRALPVPQSLTCLYGMAAATGPLVGVSVFSLFAPGWSVALIDRARGLDRRWSDVQE